jgi:uncharacterized protein DUF4157
MSIGNPAICGALLRNVLANEPSAAMPSWLRHEMERRFDAPLAGVRLFCGPGANALCVKIGARAFAINGDVLFRAGEWRPAEPSGARLIAHELAHVLQQRGRQGPDGDAMVEIGAPNDTIEVEAEVLAEEAMRAGRRSPITRDATRLLRRALVFDPQSATIVVDRNGSTPAVTVSTLRKLCFMHLTRGANLFISPPPGVITVVTPAAASAINLEGRVDGFYDNVGRDNIGDLNGWRFRMRQITQVNEASAVYANPANDAGALKYDMALPPLAPAGVALSYASDAVRSALPFMNDSAEIFLPMPNGKSRITNDMDDHPKWGIPLARLNRSDGQYYLIFEAIRDQEFLSAFMAIDPKGKATTLAHVCWRAYWKIRCKFVGLTCLPQLVSSKFEVDKPEKGAPDDAELAALLTDLTPDYSKTANSWTETASANLKNADLGVQFTPHWPDSVPDDFYQP